MLVVRLKRVFVHRVCTECLAQSKGSINICQIEPRKMGSLQIYSLASTFALPPPIPPVSLSPCVENVLSTPALTTNR